MLQIFKDIGNPWCDFRGRATEGVATWLSRLPGGVAAYFPSELPSPTDARVAAGHLRALVRDRVTTNPATGAPLSPVQVHLLELVLGAVDWPKLAVAAGLLPEDGPAPRLAGACRGGPS